MDIDAIKSEIDSDPLTLGYAGMTDQQVADSLNGATRTANRTTIPAHEIIEAIVPAEWAALSDAEKSRVSLIVSGGDVNVQGSNTRAALAAAFGAGTTSRTNMLGLQTESTTRAAELSLGGAVKTGHVAEARRLP